MDKTTVQLCAQASYQIEAMCFALKAAARSDDVDALPYLVQSMAQRILELSNAWMLSHDGMDDEVSDFEQVVFGNRPRVTV